jgi:hypothetical protein
MPALKIEFTDDVTAKLQRLYKESPLSLDRALKHATTKLKWYINESERRKFGDRLRVRDDENSKGSLATKFKKTGRTRYKIEAHPRFQILEKGGDIFPKKGDWMTFQIGDDWIRTNWVTIPPNAFFKPGLRQALREDAINKALNESINLEFKRLKLR